VLPKLRLEFADLPLDQPAQNAQARYNACDSLPSGAHTVELTLCGKRPRRAV
jgi:hypothetical protein